MHPAARLLDSPLSTKALRAIMLQQFSTYTRSQMLTLQPLFDEMSDELRRQLNVPTKPIRASRH